MNWLIQAIGIVGMVFLFCSYQQKKRKNLILCKLGADAVWVIHYCLLGAFGGAIPNFVGIFRELVFVNREKKWADSPLWPALFILLNWCLALLKWKSALTLLPICASTFVTISLWVKKPMITRLITVPVSVCFIIYDVSVGSWAGIINEAVVIASVISSMIRIDVKEYRVNKNNFIERTGEENEEKTF